MLLCGLLLRLYIIHCACNKYILPQYKKCKKNKYNQLLTWSKLKYSLKVLKQKFLNVNSQHNIAYFAVHKITASS